MGECDWVGDCGVMVCVGWACSKLECSDKV